MSASPDPDRARLDRLREIDRKLWDVMAADYPDPGYSVLRKRQEEAVESADDALAFLARMR